MQDPLESSPLRAICFPPHSEGWKHFSCIYLFSGADVETAPSSPPLALIPQPRRDSPFYCAKSPLKMVLGVVMMATMLPTMIGLNEATQGSRDQEENRRTTERKQRVHLVATCSLSQGTPELRQQIQNAKVYVGLDGKVSLRPVDEHEVSESKLTMYCSSKTTVLYDETPEFIYGPLQWRILSTSRLSSQ